MSYLSQLNSSIPDKRPIWLDIGLRVIPWQVRFELLEGRGELLQQLEVLWLRREDVRSLASKCCSHDPRVAMGEVTVVAFKLSDIVADTIKQKGTVACVMQLQLLQT